MKRPRPLPAGPGQRLRSKTQRTTSATAQPNRVMIELWTMRTELVMRLTIPQGLGTIKSEFAKRVHAVHLGHSRQSI
jgi:hypothetical protein